MLKNVLLVIFASLLTVGCAGKVNNNGLDGSADGHMTQLQKDFVAAVGHDKVHFAYDKSDLSAENKDILNKQAEWLNSGKYKNVKASIQGHADERGTREYNLALGERRAKSVQHYLKKQGVHNDRLSTISYGKERPEVLGDNEEAWAKNRRAQTVLEDTK